MKKTGVTKIVTDGWANLFAGMGGRGDKTARTRYAAGYVLDRSELDSLYRFGGFARRVIDLPAFDMTREWIEIAADKDGAVLQYMDEIGARPVFREALQWADLYGGGLIVMGLDDGGMLDQPLNEAGLRNIGFLRAYDRHQITLMDADIDQNPESPFFGQHTYYTIQPYSGGVSFRVHRSRVLRFDGADIPGRARQANQGWGDSILQACYDELKNYGAAHVGAANIVQDFIQTTVTIENLQQLLAAGQEDLVQKRLNLMDLSRSVMNTVLLDKEEQYTKHASSIAGLPELLDRFALALSGVTGIPATKLFGRAPAGLNSTGESDTRAYYDEVRARQQDRLAPALERFVRLIMLCRDGPLRGKELKDWTIEFCPLWQNTEIQEADVRYKIAQADEVYVRNGVLDPAEVAKSRFGGDKYSPETALDPAMREADMATRKQFEETTEQ